jgi:hypothetical protein
MKFALILQSYGAIHEYRRAIFSIWSFYSQPSVLELGVAGIVFTDNVDFFKLYCEGLPLKFILLTPEKINKMRGSRDFVHRLKIGIIDEAFDVFEGNLLYVDSDTFFVGHPLKYTEQLSADVALMHKFEYRFEDMKDFELPALASFRAFYSFLQSRSFTLGDGTQLQVSPGQISWNAGVILLHGSHRSYLKDVLFLTDEFYSGTQHFGCEQYAFSVILDHYITVKGCEDMVYHYWLPVKKPIADKFISHRITKEWAGRPMNEKIVEIKKWTLDFPSFFDQDVLMMKYQAIQSFNRNSFMKGYFYSAKAILKNPFDFRFFRDIGYHTRRLLTGKTAKLWQ